MAKTNKGGFFARLGRFIDGTRRWTLNLMFLFFIGFLIYSFVGFRPTIPERGVLVLSPEGTVVDQLSAVDLATELMGPGMPTETRLQDLIDAIDIAAGDERIEVLLLVLDDLNHIGLSKTLELSQAITRFRESGKMVVATAGDYDQDSYLLAAQADQVFVHSMGGVRLEGFAVVRNYFREAINKLKINFHVFKVGNFKSALEPFVRDDMSPAAKEANEAWLAQLWTLYRDTVIERRQIKPDEFDFYVNHIDQVLEQNDGDSAAAALSYGLIDGVIGRPELRAMMMERVGQDSEGYFNQIYYRDYLSITQDLPPLPGEPVVGLIVASGNIVDGEQPPGMIGGDSLARLISQARRDDDVKAVVLRIDSGGGSAFASEVIREELVQLKAAGKPLVISMGSMAASGGYWISADADEIWATPATLTGSIGIFGAFPTFERLLDQLGVSTDGVGTTKVAGKLRSDRPLDPVVANVIQSSIEHGYRRFIQVVADGREKLPEQVESIAEGRVWSGIDAQQVGLVDKLGSLGEALESAAGLAGLPSPEYRVIAPPKSPQEELISILSGAGVAQHVALLPAPVSALVNSLLPSWKAINTLQDPKGMYAYCILCVAP
ncbi:signal peptide peptidase SppA [Spongiibacter taiwanensis]|uniref:signal peptide peptidase SppA n=1 Tax=Spongiibacter taiwanensis TaxID=1748242 RepID=UPI002034EA4C|nr:signal peptide peptidase SppA [Spongiibacter taiwanensis]USA44125.1 signal peptide peptidase SppA [Spongiibacter taiwanensis]